MSFVLLLTGVGAERNTNEVFFFFFFFFFSFIFFVCCGVVWGLVKDWFHFLSLFFFNIIKILFFFFFFFFFFLVYFLCVEGRRRGWSKLGFFSFVLYILITMSN